MNTTKTIPFIVTKRNYVFENYSQSKFGPSEAQPDQTLSLRELLRRHASGLPLAGNVRQPIYDDNEIPNFATMDLADIQEHAEQLNAEVSKIDKAQKDKQKAEAAEKLRKSIIDEHTEQQRWEQENNPIPPQPN